MSRAGREGSDGHGGDSGGRVRSGERAGSTHGGLLFAVLDAASSADGGAAGRVPDADAHGFDLACAAMDAGAILADCRLLEQERLASANLYRQVRACALIAAACRWRLQDDPAFPHGPPVPDAAWADTLGRRFPEAVQRLWQEIDRHGPGRRLIAALGLTYQRLQFHTLANQVRRSVRSVRGNKWLFRGGVPDEHPLRVIAALHAADPATGLRPVLRESTPVRLDLSHSGWSDIFFLAMERPEWARVINCSVDISLPGVDEPPRTPITAAFRVIDAPVVRLTAIDLGETADLTTVAAVFDFAADHLSLLKAALVASGLVPPVIEGSDVPLERFLEHMVGPGLGIELASEVRGIPKGSRLAVSTNLLGALIAVCMRATGQIRQAEGPLAEDERRVVASRAILGEWLGGSGGGWQDSGGLWPGIKLITGEAATPADPEWGVSRGTLLPRHTPVILDDGAREAFERSLVVFHGGMSMNVGPVLEQVTTKHLLDLSVVRAARRELASGIDGIVAALRAGNCRRLGALTEAAFLGPLRRIVPAVDNAFTSALIANGRAAFGDAWWGFAMLGGMSGGGMAVLVDPAQRARVLDEWPRILLRTAREFHDRLPFVIAPGVCSVAINRIGTSARLLAGHDAVMPPAYYHLHAPLLVRAGAPAVSAEPRRRADLLNAIEVFGGDAALEQRLLRAMVSSLVPAGVASGVADASALDALAREWGFDADWQRSLQDDLRARRIGLARNRLPAHTPIADPPPDAVRAWDGVAPGTVERARQAIAAGEVATVILAAGLGSRWSGGAGLVKALCPVTRLGDGFPSFLELHLRKRLAQDAQVSPLVLTTGLPSHAAINAQVARWRGTRPDLVEGVSLSPGRAVCQRVVPMVDDLEALLAHGPRQRLDPRQEKAREDRDRAWMAWARSSGEGSPYRGGTPKQVLNPPGHWWEVPNLLLNGRLRDLLGAQPRLRHLLVHNIDTLGVTLEARALAHHLDADAAMTVEVIPRLAGDAGGGLALVNRAPQLIEGLAMPDDRLEQHLRWYNTNTCWIDIDRLLAAFALDRAALADADRVRRAVMAVSARVPVYVTIKEVRRRWGHGQEDILPVAQFEQLWGDMTALPGFPCAYLDVPRRRGQQLKDVAQIDDWLADGSAAHVAGLCGLATG